jgi:hypothetical protein
LDIKVPNLEDIHAFALQFQPAILHSPEPLSDLGDMLVAYRTDLRPLAPSADQRSLPTLPRGVMLRNWPRPNKGYGRPQTNSRPNRRVPSVRPGHPCWVTAGPALTDASSLLGRASCCGIGRCKFSQDHTRSPG